MNIKQFQIGWIILLVLAIGIIITIASSVNPGKIDPTSQTVGPMNSSVITNQNIPEVTGYIDDSANLLDADTKASLTTTLTEFAKTDKGELAILTVPSMNGLNIEEFGIRVGEKWKVGKAGIDNGVIIIIALSERKVRIEVGRGANITDAQAGQILDNKMVPKLKQGDWNGAVKAGTEEIILLMNK
jgi:uncharacterized protein